MAVKIDINEKRGTIEVYIQNHDGALLSPRDFDIANIREIIDLTEAFIANGDKNRPLISYEIKDGSVRNIFTSSVQSVAVAATIFQMANTSKSLDDLEFKTAEKIAAFQKIAVAKKWDIDLIPSTDKSHILKITPETDFNVKDEIWVDSEFYLYGTVEDFGGKSRANIHINTDELGLIKVESDRDTLSAYNRNPVYKPIGVRVNGRQSLMTGEIDTSKLKLLEILDYRPIDEADLDKKRMLASETWKDVDADKWLDEIRGPRGN